MTWHPEENVSEWVFFKSQKLLDILDEDDMSATFLRFAPVFIQSDPIYCNPEKRSISISNTFPPWLTYWLTNTIKNIVRVSIMDKVIFKGTRLRKTSLAEKVPQTLQSNEFMEFTILKKRVNKKNRVNRNKNQRHFW